MASGRVGWAEQVVWWHAYPLTVVGAEGRLEEVEGVAHRLPRFEAWLDHLISLGANGLLLGPVFASATHGYDTVDYLRIDPRLGNDADFDALVAACRERGVRLLLDGVFNHAGRGFPPVAQALREGPGCEAADWVSALYDNNGMISADYFEGHDTLVTLDHRSPRMQGYGRSFLLSGCLLSIFRRKVFLPVFLRRRPNEPADSDLSAFHHRLWAVAPLVRRRTWHRCEVTGWPDNPSAEALLAWTWRDGDAG